MVSNNFTKRRQSGFKICTRDKFATSSFQTFPCLRKLFVADIVHGLFAFFKAPSTQIRFQTKTELFCSGYVYRPHYNVETEPFENALQSGAI